jgi:hypothetical protein
MATPGSKFSRKKEAAIAALLGQRNIEEAAESIGIRTKTMLRWLKLPEFDAAYRQARRRSGTSSDALSYVVALRASSIQFIAWRGGFKTGSPFNGGFSGPRELREEPP